MTGDTKSCLIIGAAAARRMHARGYGLALLSPSESCERLAAERGRVAAFLLSEDSACVTGQSLRVDGGVTRSL